MSHHPTDWRTSSFSSNGSNCVEVLERADGAWLRDSKDRRGPALHLGPAPWRAFLVAVAAGGDPGGSVRVCPDPDGGRRVEDVGRAETLHFTRGEWSAFRSGVRAGEFGDPGTPTSR